MHNLLVFFHVAGAIFWMGGMGFMLLALRPAAAAMLQPPERLRLLVEVLRRFFWVVAAAIVVLLLTGGTLMATAAAAGQALPRGWHAMAGIGGVMALLFGHIVAAPYRRSRRAVAASDWPEAGRCLGQVALFVRINFVLGWLAIAAVLFWR